jgi:hypothetical protein
MNEQDGKVNVANDEPSAAQNLSPAEKLDDGQRAAEPVPGVENPASTEVKQEQQPNTE